MSGDRQQPEPGIRLPSDPAWNVAWSYARSVCRKTDEFLRVAGHLSVL
jgi:hypothetical protein